MLCFKTSVCSTLRCRTQILTKLFNKLQTELSTLNLYVFNKASSLGLKSTECIFGPIRGRRQQQTS